MNLDIRGYEHMQSLHRHVLPAAALARLSRDVVGRTFIHTHIGQKWDKDLVLNDFLAFMQTESRMTCRPKTKVPDSHI